MPELRQLAHIRQQFRWIGMGIAGIAPSFDFHGLDIH